MTEITVPVPDDRTAEFYQFFGLWLAGGQPLSRSIWYLSDSCWYPGSRSDGRLRKAKPWTGADADLEDAEALWRKYSPRARAMFSLLMDTPDKKYTGR